MLTLHAGAAEVVVAPDHGGRVDRLRVGPHDLLLTAADDPGGSHWGAFVMAPWAGRVRHGRFRFGGQLHQLPVTSGVHAIHGTVRDRSWVVEEADPLKARLSCLLGPDWPWAGWCEQQLILSPDQLQLHISVHTEGDPFPASAGWHPWWRRRVGGVDATLDLPARSMYHRDPEGIPTGELVLPPPGPWDDCFTDLIRGPTLRWGVVSVAIDATGPCVVVYDQPADSICVEPQTGPPDALNLAPVLVEPGRPLRLATTIHWRA